MSKIESTEEKEVVEKAQNLIAEEKKMKVEDDVEEVTDNLLAIEEKALDSSASRNRQKEERVKPKEPLKIISGLCDVAVKDGDRIDLVVELNMEENYDVAWHHNNVEIKSDNKDYEIYADRGRHELKIPEVFPEDAGIWAFDAISGENKVETGCTLTVLGKIINSIFNAF